MLTEKTTVHQCYLQCCYDYWNHGFRSKPNHSFSGFGFCQRREESPFWAAFGLLISKRWLLLIYKPKDTQIRSFGLNAVQKLLLLLISKPKNARNYGCLGGFGLLITQKVVSVYRWSSFCLSTEPKLRFSAETEANRFSKFQNCNNNTIGNIILLKHRCSSNSLTKNLVRITVKRLWLKRRDHVKTLPMWWWRIRFPPIMCSCEKFRKSLT